MELLADPVNPELAKWHPALVKISNRLSQIDKARELFSTQRNLIDIPPAQRQEYMRQLLAAEESTLQSATTLVEMMKARNLLPRE